MQIMEYVVFDLDFLYHMANMIRSNVGTIFSVCIYLFLGVVSIFIIQYIISSIVEYYFE